MAPDRIKNLRSIGCPLDKSLFAYNTSHYDIQRGVVGCGSSINNDDVGVARAATDMLPLERMGPNCITEQWFQKVADRLVKCYSMYGIWHVTYTENPLLYRYVSKCTFNSNSDNARSNNKKYAQRCKSWRTKTRIVILF
jgi:hypothetical protein